jgi:SsrA-binding protein
VERKGYTLVALAVYLNPRGLIKIRIALAEGKTLGDKRESLILREQKREMDRIRKGDRE